MRRQVALHVARAVQAEVAMDVRDAFRIQRRVGRRLGVDRVRVAEFLPEDASHREVLHRHAVAGGQHALLLEQHLLVRDVRFEQADDGRHPAPLQLDEILFDRIRPHQHAIDRRRRALGAPRLHEDAGRIEQHPHAEGEAGETEHEDSDDDAFAWLVHGS